MEQPPKTERKNPDALKKAALGAAAAALIHLVAAFMVHGAPDDFAYTLGRLTGPYLISFGVAWFFARRSKNNWPLWKYVAVSFGVYFVLLLLLAGNRANA